MKKIKVEELGLRLVCSVFFANFAYRSCGSSCVTFSSCLFRSIYKSFDNLVLREFVHSSQIFLSQLLILCHLQSLDSWKTRRRRATHSALERKASREEVELNEQSRQRRRSKTYQEMMEEK